MHIKIQNNMFYNGNSQIFNERKTAFFCSRRCPAEKILKTYDWAVEQREKGTCIISGFHSRIERDVFHYLLKGNQPIILALARGLMKRYDQNIKQAVADNRLLIISPFDKNVKRVTTENAQVRNKMMIELADEIFVAHASKGGNIEKLIKECGNSKSINFLK